MSFESVKAKNPGVKMYLVTDPAFQKYGRVIKGYDFSSYVAYLKDHTAVPETGNQYVASIPVVGTLICVGITRLFTKLRVEHKEELIGLDTTQHGEQAYPSFNGLD